MSQFIAYKDGLLHICEVHICEWVHRNPAIPETITCEFGELEAHAHVCNTGGLHTCVLAHAYTCSAGWKGQG